MDPLASNLSMVTNSKPRSRVLGTPTIVHGPWISWSGHRIVYGSVYSVVHCWTLGSVSGRIPHVWCAAN